MFDQLTFDIHFTVNFGCNKISLMYMHIVTIRFLLGLFYLLLYVFNCLFDLGLVDLEARRVF